MITSRRRKPAPAEAALQSDALGIAAKTLALDRGLAELVFLDVVEGAFRNSWAGCQGVWHSPSMA